MYQTHYRWAIFNQGQHIYRHTLSDFQYINEALPGVTNVEMAMNWILAVLYPQTQESVNTVGDLPLVGNTLNDYRVVLDDGDGKAASYRWEQREGEASPSWHKIYDMDWGADSILENFENIANDKYVVKLGKTDIDASGNAIVGTYAGQIIYGGNAAGQNLTFNANSADSNGYVQTDNHFRPTADNSYDLGTGSLMFRQGFFGTGILVDTMVLSGGYIVDASGSINFDSTNLTNIGTIGAGAITGTSFIVGTLTISDGSIVDTDGTINFGSTSLTTTGTITGAANSVLADLTFANGSITSASGAITFNDENISTTGTASFGNTTVTRLDSDNLRLDGNTISAQNVGGGIVLVGNGAGVIDIQSAMTTIGQTVTGTVGITGQLNIDNLRADGNTLSSTDANGDIVLSPNGTGLLSVTSKVSPNADNALDLGATASRFATLFLGTAISDGTTSITSSVLQSLRDINVGVGVGFSLFWDGSKWAASEPDSEIDHTTLSNLTTGDSGHTQFALLAGRAGGQSLIGGTAAGEHLILESTADASKGLVKTKDSFVPNTTAAYAAGWSGTDLGGSSNYFNDLYTKGELKGARVENYTEAGLPAFSAQNTGRLLWSTDTKRLWVDTGAAVVNVGVNRFLSDVAFDGIVTTKDVTVSSTISDARRAIWALHDNAGDYDRIYCSIKATSASNVRITTTGALPAGSYRLIGIE